ncbi:hypothetical protein DEA8626_02899 [Defluviimonas aquaemixtae]|uniref:Siroheme decarboxylase NirG subunit n=1 Tax=Albidovulum aquaemixtae TaxID=1542388 RepID=A0A2R8BKB6_9RHOB|nr:AsnC family transcriptional regulator [Defluviimonas aquaemixtae]SPH23827.1 hypothetical protein DEA8626_02899 [Defluviimonas aquaemixtae]
MRRTPLPPDSLDDTDRRVLNALQEDGFPLSPRPFAEVAAQLGIDESDLIRRLLALRDLGAITRFGPFFDAEALGGAFCLCAMSVPPDRFDAVATLVNAHPEVAHNYERSHKLNMWFVLATERPKGISETAERIEKETGLKVLLFPKLREFFVRFKVAA